MNRTVSERVSAWEIEALSYREHRALAGGCFCLVNAHAAGDVVGRNRGVGRGVRAIPVGPRGLYMLGLTGGQREKQRGCYQGQHERFHRKFSIYLKPDL